MNTKFLPAAVIVALAAFVPSRGWAQSHISEDFTKDVTSNDWYFFNGACLTAGSSTATGTPGQIPGCKGLASSYYKEMLVGGAKGFLGSTTAPSGLTAVQADPVGQGALRFTNGFIKSGYKNDCVAGYGGYCQNGAIVSKTPFLTGQGVQITFKTVTYLGNSGGTGGDGADGISFFLMDGGHDTGLGAPGVGAWGGSLGYSCSNSNPPYNGLIGAYLGLGIDEFGNFLNQGDNTALGYGYVPGRIGLRGAGNISAAWISANYPTLTASWSAANLQSATQNSCKSGYLTDYNNNSVKDSSNHKIPLADYAPIPNANVTLSGVKIANESATTRSAATVILYKLKITEDGLLSFSYSNNGGTVYNSVITNQKITDYNGPLPSTLRFGFAGSTGGSTNVHEIMCFKADPVEQAATSVGVNEKQASKIATGTQAFLASYLPSEWTGRLTANDLNLSTLNGTSFISINTTANWDGSCVLNGVATGKTCSTTNATGLIAAEAPSSRVILSYDGSQGIPFEWNSLSTTQQGMLNYNGDAGSTNSNRLAYLRGDRSNEIDSTGNGLFRARSNVLGDIVDSSPSWVGPASNPYAMTWKDRLQTNGVVKENSGTQTYAQFMTSTQTRLNVVYSGANDGLLHGFRAGAYKSDGKFDKSLNDGKEVLAYMPSAVLRTIHDLNDATLDYSSTKYGHNFFVDATPGTDDLFYGGTWHTWLVGGLGAGGGAIYALEVTDPSATNFTEGNAASIVIGEWGAGTETKAGAIKCTNVTDCGTNLGNTYGVPVIRRLHNGAWAAIFGNGFHSTTGDAGIYIMSVDPTSGTKTFYYLSANKTGANGIANVAPADLDGDHITDYVYAGDLLGNVWRFDLTDTDPTKWKVTSSPVFSTGGQPITTKLVLAVLPPATALGPQRLMVDFGTGQKIPPTTTTPVSFANGTQTLYGIWDWNMGSWNALSGQKYASLTGTQSIVASGSGQNLQTQTLTKNSLGDLDASSNPVCWNGSMTCGTKASDNTQFGWIISLPGSNGGVAGSTLYNEQVVYNPVFYQGAFVVNTIIPANNDPASCTTSADTGNTIAVSVATGGAIPHFFTNYGDAMAAGFQTNGSGSPFVLMAGSDTYLITQTTTGENSDGSATQGPGPFYCGDGLCSTSIKPPGATGRRLTWIEKR